FFFFFFFKKKKKKRELRTIIMNILIWLVPLVVSLQVFGKDSSERQLSLLTLIGALHTLNAWIMLRPKDLYYSLRDSWRCKRNCLRIRRKYRLEHASFLIPRQEIEISIAAAATAMTMNNMTTIANGEMINAATLAAARRNGNGSNNVITNDSSSQLQNNGSRRIAIGLCQQLTLEDIVSEKQRIRVVRIAFSEGIVLGKCTVLGGIYAT
ncbi:hypothetical protein RFI_15897, partial [Reticulomyxa filosa]